MTQERNIVSYTFDSLLLEVLHLPKIENSKTCIFIELSYLVKFTVACEKVYSTIKTPSTNLERWVIEYLTKGTIHGYPVYCVNTPHNNLVPKAPDFCVSC